MSSEEIADLLQFIADEPGKLLKIEYLSEALEDGEFERVVVAAYDPYVRYYLKTVELQGGGVGIFSTECVWELLDKLSSRELSGNAARDAIYKLDLQPASRELFRNILNKDLKAGFDNKSINKAKKGLIPVVSYMRCSLLKHIDLDTWDWTDSLSELKADGTFVFAANGRLQTRLGLFYELVPDYLEEDLSKLASKEELHGELLIYRDGELLNRKTSNGLANSLRLGTPLPEGHLARLVVWDLIHIDGENALYKERLDILKQYLLTTSDSVELIETRKVSNIDEAMAHYHEVRKRGFEGTILKSGKLPFKSHTSKLQVKIKNDSECDLEIVALTPGTGRNAETFGSLACTSSCGGLSVNVAGLTDALREEIFNHWSEWDGSIISVTFNELIHDKAGQYSLFLPRFKESRLHEKDVADSLAYIRNL